MFFLFYSYLAMKSIILIAAVITIMSCVLQYASAQLPPGPGINIDLSKLDLSKIIKIDTKWLDNLKNKADTFGDCQRKCSGKIKACKKNRCGHVWWPWMCERSCDADAAGCIARCI